MQSATPAADDRLAASRLMRYGGYVMLVPLLGLSMWLLVGGLRNQLVPPTHAELTEQGSEYEQLAGRAMLDPAYLPRANQARAAVVAQIEEIGNHSGNGMMNRAIPTRVGIGSASSASAPASRNDASPRSTVLA